MAPCIIPRFAIFYRQLFLFSSFSQFPNFYLKLILTTVPNFRFYWCVFTDRIFATPHVD